MVHLHDTKLHLFIGELEELLSAEHKAFGVHMSTDNLAPDLIIVTSDLCPPNMLKLSNQPTLTSTTDYSTSASAHGSATCNDETYALHCNAHHTVLLHHVFHSTTLFYPWNFVNLQATLKLSYLWSGPTDHSYTNTLKHIITLTSKL